MSRRLERLKPEQIDDSDGSVGSDGSLQLGTMANPCYSLTLPLYMYRLYTTHLSIFVSLKSVTCLCNNNNIIILNLLFCVMYPSLWFAISMILCDYILTNFMFSFLLYGNNSPIEAFNLLIYNINKHTHTQTHIIQEIPLLS